MQHDPNTATCVVQDGAVVFVLSHPSFANLQVIELMSKGGLVAVIASIDPIIGEVDR